MDAGGVFFGVRENRTIRIAAWRPVEAEKNALELLRVIESAKADPLLRNLVAAGWFLSRMRGGLDLTADEIGVFDGFFPAPWQFTMLLRPELIGPTRAAFFVRAPGGKLAVHDPRREFSIAPMRTGRRAAKAAALRADADGAADVAAASERADKTPTAAPSRARNARKMSSRQWLCAIPITAFLAWGGFLATGRFFPGAQPAPAPALSLRVQDTRNGQLHVDWDRNAPAVRFARRGLLELSDAGRRRTFNLGGEELRRGSFTYGRRSGDVQVKLSVFGNSGAPAGEAAHFIGPKPGDSDLEIEIKELREQLARESSRNEQLEKLVRRLQNRIAADQ